MPYKDPEEQRRYQQAYQGSYQKERYEKKKQELVDHLGGMCNACGCKEGLEFDHVDPATKSFSIMSRWKDPILLLDEELAKCQLLCKPCHKGKHGWKHGTRAGYAAGCRESCCREPHNAYSREWKRHRRDQAKAANSPPKR